MPIMSLAQPNLYTSLTPQASAFMRLGLVGEDISHSLSPKLHEGWLADFNLQGSYGLIDETAFTKALLERLILEGYRGVNITSPFKMKAAQLATKRDEIVSQTGVANTMLFTQGEVWAWNTDAEALTEALSDADLTSALVLGGGATARTTIWVLQHLGCNNIQFITRSTQTQIPGAKALKWNNQGVYRIPQKPTIIINTLSIELEDYLEGKKIEPSDTYVQWSYIYPLPFFSKPIRMVKGFDLLKAQGRKSFEYWVKANPRAIHENYLTHEKIPKF